MINTPSIKGQSFNILKKFVAERCGDQALVKVFQHLEAGDRELISTVILDISWQPEQSFLNFLNTVDKVLGRGDYALCRKIGIYSAKESVSKFYKIFIRFGDPGFVIEHAGNFWSQIHNHGRLEVRKSSPVSALATVYDFKIPHKAFCHYLEGYFQGVLEMSGAKNILITEIKCVCDGDDCCEFAGEWR